MARAFVVAAAVAVITTAAACGSSSPTTPSPGSASGNSRLVGQFASGDTAALGAVQRAGTPLSAGRAHGIVVQVQDQPSLTTSVNQTGTFVLPGIPSGAFTLVFERGNAKLGEIPFRDVGQRQDISIVVLLTPEDEVVLIGEERDAADDLPGGCPRGAGFWCQAQRGRNPNLTEEEFETFAAAAAALLASVPALDTPDEVAAAVCDTGSQLLRQLAALALNLAADTVTPATSLAAPAPYATVGAAFEAAIAHLTGAAPLDAAGQEALKDAIEGINDGAGSAECAAPVDDPDTDPDESDDDSDDDEDASAQRLTICHIPPGNFEKRRTLTISESAWPAHQRHCADGNCDFIGSCQ